MNGPGQRTRPLDVPYRRFRLNPELASAFRRPPEALAVPWLAPGLTTDHVLIDPSVFDEDDRTPETPADHG